MIDKMCMRFWFLFHFNDDHKNGRNAKLPSNKMFIK